MVSPVLYIAVPLAVAFLLPLTGRGTSAGRRGAGRELQAAVLLFVLGSSLLWLRTFVAGAAPVVVSTGGWPPPLGINLRLGATESLLVALAAATALGVSVHAMLARPRGTAEGETVGHDRRPTLELLMFVGAAGLIMTRDVFNMFVFLEVSSIATYALAVAGEEGRGLEAGFKYMFLGAVGSVFILVSIAFLYRMTGTLNLDGMAAALSGAAPGIVGVALSFLLAGMAVELKLFPLNGPAIDLYEGVSPSVMALVGGTTVNAALYAFWKMQSLFAAVQWTYVIAAVGVVGFVVANALAVRQKSVRRMLGYSTSAQLGLAVFLLPFVATGFVSGRAVVLLIVNHTLCKAGLLWFAGAHGGETRRDWREAFARSPFAALAMTALVLGIAGLPPFPGFWGKWEALTALAGTAHAWWIAPVLAGSLLEFVYYFGWLRQMHSRGAEVSEKARADTSASPDAPVGPRPAFSYVFAAASLAVGLWFMRDLTGPVATPAFVLGAAGLLLLALRALPGRLLGAAALVAVAAAGWVLYSGGHAAPNETGGLFLAIVLGGSLMAAIAALGAAPARRSYHGLFLLLVSSLVLLVGSRTLLGFFVAWELMTWTSYLLVAEGRRASRGAYIYMLFSGAAGFLVFGGLLLLEGAGLTLLGAG